MNAEEKDQYIADRLVERLRYVVNTSDGSYVDVINTHEEAVRISSVALNIVSRLIEEAHDGVVRVSIYERAWYDNLPISTRTGLWVTALNILHMSYREDL